MKYSIAEKGQALPMVLEVRTGAVDRGAYIRDFSQYRDEVRCAGRAGPRHALADAPGRSVAGGSARARRGGLLL